MKLLFINGHLNTGGVEKSLVDVLRHMDFDKHEVHLLLLEGLGDYAPLLPPQVQVHLCDLHHTYGSLSGSLLGSVRAGDWLCFRMRLIFLAMKLFGVEKISMARKLLTGGERYDCVIGYRPGICTQIASFAVDAKRRLSWWHHGCVNVDPAAYLRETAPCDSIAVVSEACSAILSESMPPLSSKLVSIPNLLDAEAIQGQAGKTAPFPNDGRLHLVSVGRLAPEKHFENAVAAAARLKSTGIRFSWHLLGDGPERASLEAKLKACGVSDCFHLEGNQPNPYPWMKGADLFVHSSYVESQGIVVLEAMALGVPCVVTKSLGPCEFIEDGVNGILTEQSQEDLADKVLEMLTNQALYEHIKQNTACPEQFRPERVMEKIEALIGG